MGNNIIITKYLILVQFWEASKYQCLELTPSRVENCSSLSSRFYHWNDNLYLCLNQYVFSLFLYFCFYYFVSWQKEKYTYEHSVYLYVVLIVFFFYSSLSFHECFRFLPNPIKVDDISRHFNSTESYLVVVTNTADNLSVFSLWIF